MKLHHITKQIILAAAILLGTAGILMAQDKPACCHKGQEKHSCHKGSCCGIPDLTQEQQTKIEGLRTAMVTECLNIKNQIEEKRAHLNTLMTVEQPDMTAINSTIDEMYVLKAQLEKKKVAHIQEIRNILTPEQRLQFDMNHAKRGMGEGMGPGHPGHKAGCSHHGKCGMKEQGCQKQGQGCHHQGQGCQHGK